MHWFTDSALLSDSALVACFFDCGSTIGVTPMRCQIGVPYIARNYRGTSYLFCDVFEGWAELSQSAEHCRRTLRFTAVLAVNAHAVVSLVS